MNMPPISISPASSNANTAMGGTIGGQVNFVGAGGAYSSVDTAMQFLRQATQSNPGTIYNGGTYRFADNPTNVAGFAPQPKSNSGTIVAIVAIGLVVLFLLKR